MTVDFVNDSSLHAGLRAALRRVWVAPDKTTATVDGREIEASTPREMRRMLSESIYNSVHTGQRVENGDLPFRLRDAEFEAALGEAVPHELTTTTAVVRRTADQAGDDAAVLVERDGVRVWMPLDSVVGENTPVVGDRVALTVPASRPALSPGFFLVDGARPRSWEEGALRVYVHVTDWQHAARIWGAALRYLENERVAYRAKVLSAKLLYPRRDAIVFYLTDRDCWQIAAELADELRDMVGVGHETSLFAAHLVPGVAAACEPDDDRPGMRGLSFGQHRSTSIAQALVETAGSSELLEHTIRQRCIEANIDPDEPARNNRKASGERTESA